MPKDLNISHIEASIQELKNVRSTHHKHICSLDGEHHVLTTHVVLEEDIPKDEVIHIKEKIREIANQFKMIHTTVEIEYGKEECTSGRER